MFLFQSVYNSWKEPSGGVFASSGQGPGLNPRSCVWLADWYPWHDTRDASHMHRTAGKWAVFTQGFKNLPLEWRWRKREVVNELASLETSWLEAEGRWLWGDHTATEGKRNQAVKTLAVHEEIVFCFIYFFNPIGIQNFKSIALQRRGI